MEYLLLSRSETTKHIALWLGPALFALVGIIILSIMQQREFLEIMNIYKRNLYNI